MFSPVAICFVLLERLGVEGCGSRAPVDARATAGRELDVPNRFCVQYCRPEEGGASLDDIV
jgi:hypothetical protein